jgi:hypothetical protein
VDATDAVLAQYLTAQGNLRLALLTALARMWAGLTSWRDADAQAFAAQAVPLVAGAQNSTATLTAAYLARMVATMSGAPPPPPRVNPATVTGHAVRAANPAEVYRRPFVQVWTDLSKGADLNQAVQAGGRRLQNIAATDLQLAKTNAAQQVLSIEHRVVGYRRVLTGNQSCGLCIVASTQRYRKSELLPIHPGCDCSVSPVLAGQDPGRVLDEGALSAAHDAIRQRFGRAVAGARGPVDYRKALITHDHGEIGPVLAVRGQHFDRGPARKS